MTVTAKISNDLGTKLLKHTFCGNTYTAPTNVEFALCLTAPDEAGSGLVECAGTGYARKSR